jgi:hypothetical protein
LGVGADIADRVEMRTLLRHGMLLGVHCLIASVALAIQANSVLYHRPCFAD